MDWEGVFGRERGRLFALAYRMLGRVGEAEDVLQEAWMRVHRTEGVERPEAFLTTVVTRLCLDVLKSARVQRETYVGPWLPEPLQTDDAPTPEEHAQRAESITMAFLQLLEALSPLERAAFVMREVMGEDVALVAATLGREEASIRQLVHRAREHLRGGRPRFHVPMDQAQQVAAAFLGAVAAGDVTGLMAVMSPEVTVTTDSGGKVRAARRVVEGAEDVARFMVGVTRKHTPQDAEMVFRAFNGEPGVLVKAGDVPVLAMVLQTDGERVVAVNLVMNPDKLQHLH